MDHLTGLRIFREVVESGSFTTAAQRLSQSTSMVSKHIAQLEQRLGARLLNRNSRNVSLTDVGRLFYDQCKLALEMLEAAEAQASQYNAEPSGTLKISAPVWCGGPRFAQILAEYGRRYPKVTLDMYLENRIVDLAADGYDLCLRLTPEPSDSLIARPLCDVRFLLVATPSYLAQLEKKSKQTRTLSGPYLDLVVPNYFKFDYDRLPWLDAELAWPTRVAMRSNDTTLSYQAVLAGVGAAFLPHWTIEDDVVAKRLVVVPGIKTPIASIRLLAAYSSRRQIAPKIRTFIDFLAEALPKMLP